MRQSKECDEYKTNTLKNDNPTLLDNTQNNLYVHLLKTLMNTNKYSIEKNNNVSRTYSFTFENGKVKLT